MTHGAAGRIHRRSSRPGSESWQVDILFGNRALAEALRKDLEPRAGIERVRVNPWRGRVTLDFAPGSIASPIEELLRQAVERGLVAETVRTQAPAEWMSLLRVLGSSLDGGDRLAGPVALSLASHLVHILQGLSFISTVDEARNAAAKAPAGSSLRMRSVITLALSGADALLRHHKRTSWQRLARDLESDLRAKVFGAVVAQDLAVRDKIGTGRLLNAVTSDVGQLGALVDRGIDDALLNLLQALIAGGLLLVRAPRLALVAAVPLGLFVLPSRKLAKQSAEAGREQAARSDALSQILENSLSGLTEIKSYTAEDAVLRRVADSARKLTEAAKQTGTITSAQAHLFEGVFAIGFALMAVVGGSRLEKGKVSQAAYTKALYSFPQLLASFVGLQVAVAQYQGGAAAATRLLQLLDTQSTIADGTVPLPAAEVRGEVSFEGVAFGYEEGRRVVEEIDFHVPAGGMLGVVGPTGSGKSTLLRLLLRLYDVGSGRILLDGRDLRTLRIADVRSVIAMVSQEPYLFRGSVRDNVAFGRPSATDDEIREALRQAEALEFVEQNPEGLAADIGERGQRLSGGQRQRLAIARALLKRVPILVLDEATSQVDYETEAAIQRAIQNARSGRTLIVVAHRLSTIRGADQILVVDQGQIRERGRHDELLGRGGLYALLWSLQSGAAGRGAGSSG